MNSEQRAKQLYEAARLLPPSERVPYAFEKRVMAALARQPLIDPWALWSQLLWRAAAPCVGIMLITGVWAAFSGASISASEPLAADLERTVWGPLTSLGETW